MAMLCMYHLRLNLLTYGNSNAHIYDIMLQKGMKWPNLQYLNILFMYFIWRTNTTDLTRNGKPLFLHNVPIYNCKLHLLPCPFYSLPVLLEWILKYFKFGMSFILIVFKCVANTVGKFHKILPSHVFTLSYSTLNVSLRYIGGENWWQFHLLVHRPPTIQLCYMPSSTPQRVVKDQWVHRVSRAHSLAYINTDDKIAVSNFNQEYIITIHFFF